MSGRASRRIAERILIEGTLILETPAHFGNGDTVGFTDIPLLLDPLEGKQPLLTGASLAGALRTYLREFQYGFSSPGKTRRSCGPSFWQDRRGRFLSKLAAR